MQVTDIEVFCVSPLFARSGWYFIFRQQQHFFCNAEGPFPDRQHALREACNKLQITQSAPSYCTVL